MDCRLARIICGGAFLPLFVLGLSLGMAARPAIAGTAEAALKPVIDEGLQTKRTQLAEKIAELSKASSAQSSEDADVSATENEVELLQTLDVVYAQHEARLEQQQELTADKKKLEAALDNLHKFGPSEAKPYSFLLLEHLRDELSAEEDRETTIKADLKGAEQLLETAHEQLNDADRERRRIHEDLLEAEEENDKRALQEAEKMAQHECTIAVETVEMRRLEIEIRKLRHEICGLSQQELNDKIAVVAKDVRFTKKDLADRLKELSKYELELKGKLKQARAKFAEAETKQKDVFKQLDDQKAPAALQELVNESWRVARDAYQTELSHLNERLADVGRFRYYWNCRYEVENGTAEPKDLEKWFESLSDFSDQIRDMQRGLEQRIAALRIDQATLFRRQLDDESPEVEQWVTYQGQHMDRLRELCETSLVDLKAAQRWSDRFLETMEAKLKPLQKETAWTQAVAIFNEVWEYEITKLDENTSVTVGKVVRLLAYLGLGVLLARVISGAIGGRLLPRIGLNRGAATAVQAILFYSLCITFGAFSFQVVHLPFGALTFLGGAAAIAIGFGSQHIANNFMSGIIILAEQPIRVGDIVKVDGVQGTVQHIGPLSTRVRTDSNYELIFPNNKLLDDSVTNLTLSDTLVQTAIKVSFKGTLTVPRAKELLLQAASQHAKVLKTPPPCVLFKQFDSSSMDFELYFWLQMTSDMDCMIVQSEVREAINELFLASNAEPTAIGNVKPGELTLVTPGGRKSA